MERSSGRAAVLDRRIHRSDGRRRAGRGGMELIGERLGELDFADKRVTVVGLGIEGVDLARYLSRRGAFVTVSDSKTRETLAQRADEADALGVRLALGSNQRGDIAGAEAVFVSQGVPLDLPGVEDAR